MNIFIEPKVVNEIEKQLGFSFKDKDLLATALTHSSYVNEHQEDQLQSFERLEFLGDAIIGAVTAQELYFLHRDWNEGELTNRQSLFINTQNLSATASRLDLGKYLIMGKGDEKYSIRNNQRMLACVFESVVGAIFIDSGYERTREFIINNLLDNNLLKGNGTSENNKSKLQEYVQKKAESLPSYKLTEQDQDIGFTVQVSIEGKEIGVGNGRSKKIAEQKAAEQALNYLMDSDL